jgi:hypothetical protein
MAAAAVPTEDKPRRLWRSDPDRYVRLVRGGKYQARPYDPYTGTRDNLGLFHTREQAQKAIIRYWRGELQGRPKFVRRRARRGPEFFVRVWVRVGEWFATEAEAAAAAREFLERTFGRLVAAAMLSRKDTSRRAARG